MIKKSISNLAWRGEADDMVYSRMRKLGFAGLEIAPTRIFPAHPYDDLDAAKVWTQNLKDGYGLVVSSMQSIWHGRREKLFGTSGERWVLLAYTERAIDFAEVVGCHNLVFGCPKNRCMPDGADAGVAIDFFRELGEYAHVHNTVLSMEANPLIYNTNYINNTASAINLNRQVGSEGFRLNLDVGTMIYYGEDVSLLKGNEKYINHVHLSEPGLVPIQKRRLHEDLINLLSDAGYDGYVSIEMGLQEDMKVVFESMGYLGVLI